MDKNTELDLRAQTAALATLVAQLLRNDALNQGGPPGSEDAWANTLIAQFDRDETFKDAEDGYELKMCILFYLEETVMMARNLLRQVYGIREAIAQDEIPPP